MKKIVIFCFFIMCKTGMNSQNLNIENQSEFTLDKNLLLTDVNIHGELFKPLSIKEAHVKGLSTMYNYLCTNDNIFYYGNKVYNLVLKVHNDKILRVHFEIEYPIKTTLYDLIKKVGYPVSGRSNPNVEIYRDPLGDKKDQSNLIYENFNELYWKHDENYFKMSISNITPQQYFSLNNPKLWINFSIVEKFYKYQKSQNEKSNELIESIAFEKQLDIFKKLGYSFNNDLSKQKIITNMMSDNLLDYPTEYVDIHPENKLNDYFEEVPIIRLYYFFGWATWNSKERALIPFTNKCIWFDVKFLKHNIDYIEFIQRMGSITGGEIKFSNLSIIDTDDNKKIVKFNANGIQREWNINTNNIFKTFIVKFSDLTDELMTKSKFTFFRHGGEQFVLDYANEVEQVKFNKETGLHRIWLENVKY